MGRSRPDGRDPGSRTPKASVIASTPVANAVRPWDRWVTGIRSQDNPAGKADPARQVLQNMSNSSEWICDRGTPSDRRFRLTDRIMAGGPQTK